MNLQELRDAVERAAAALTAMDAEVGERSMSEDESAKWAELTKAHDEARESVVKAEERAKVEEQRAKWRSTVVAGPKATANDVNGDLRSLSRDGLKSALFRTMDERSKDNGIDPSEMQRIVRMFERQTTSGKHANEYRSWLHALTVRASDVYERAFAKYMSGDVLSLSNEERAAIAVGTNAQGGYLVPTYLDPTIILTNNGAEDKVRMLSAARGGVKTMLPGTGNVWHGVTSAGVTGSWDLEATEVSDDSPTFGTAAIPVYYGRAFVKATYQALNTIAGIESEILTLFADSRLRQESAVHVSGGGAASNCPTGIVTALDGSASELVSTTAATIGVVDINALYRQVPVRFRSQGSWLMNPIYADAIQQLGTAVGVAFTGDISQDYENSPLKGKKWAVSDDMPATQTTTVRDNEIIFGDFGQYAIIDRPGTTSVEFVQNLMGTTNGLPTGERGWLAYWETGGDVIDGLEPAFGLLVDKTSA